MKIKTLQPNNYCVAKGNADNASLTVLCTEDADCSDFAPEYIGFLGLHAKTGECITVAVGEMQPFFFTVAIFNRKKILCTTHYVGYIESENGQKRIVPTERVGGEEINLTGDETVLIYGYYPSDFRFLGEHTSCVMTSDGLVYLGPDDFLGHKDGVLEALNPLEVLEELAKYKVHRSPHYGSVDISPTKVKPPRPRKGTIIHNEVTGKLELFTNGKWRTLKFEDEE